MAWVHYMRDLAEWKLAGSWSCPIDIRCLDADVMEVTVR